METSSSLYAPGDVVVVPFPYSDRLAQKRRPALIVSNSDLHGLGLIWVVMITSAKHSTQRFDVPIHDLAKAGLQFPCVARATKIACLEPSRVLRVAGVLDDDETATVLAAARGFLDRK